MPPITKISWLLYIFQYKAEAVVRSVDMETHNANVNVSYKTDEKKGEAFLWSTDQFKPEIEKQKQIFNPNQVVLLPEP